ncbi:NUDIX hydrolase [Flavobacterium orientale]|uniref:Coenzyme A pyrophosphatase n=1 Tax=Flavobacterium orientale TaxID=1756020 RepID=A0A917DF89_9FLAO|nr:CoA pyrophosphatase [Flavobacterium orientale]GGD35438.1 coenzyme A pyrophosphatase [Flavobacterium orientale]
MDFHNFLKFIPKIAKENLPATIAHAKMAPIGRMDILEKLTLEKNEPKRAAVMMLFYPKDNETHLVLIVRNSYPGVHSSQIAFPGGKVEISDKDLQETALRETEEEIGVKKHQIEVVRAFTEIYIPPSNFLVSPFLGISQSNLEFVLQEDEVAGIIEFPLKDFLDENIIVTRRLKTSYSIAIDVPAFLVKEHIVWGATAMMLSELKETIKKVL